MAQPDYQRGLLRVATRDDVVAATEQTAIEQAQAEANSGAGLDARPTSALVAHLLTVWNKNKDAKQTIQEQMLTNLRAFRSQYEASKISAIKAQGGSEAFLGITKTKCRHAISWLFDVFTSADKPWSIAPSPKPDPSVEAMQAVQEVMVAKLREMAMQSGEASMTPELLQEIAKALKPIAVDALQMDLAERARKMELYVQDQMLAGGFTDAFRAFIRDLVTLKAGLIKGPVFRRVKTLKWVRQSGKYVEAEAEKMQPFWFSVSPLDFFPDAYATKSSDLPIVERFRLHRSELYDLRNEPGYQTEAINNLLTNFPAASIANSDFGKDSTDDDRENLNDIDQGMQQSSEKATALEFWITVPGSTMRDMDLLTIPGAPKEIDPLKDYLINAILCNNELIFVAFAKSASEASIYYKTGWDKINGSFWYDGVPESMADIQAICNASARALVNNLAIASGPQVEVDMDRLLGGEDITKIEPFRIWQTTSRGNSQSPAIRFFSPDSNAQELLSVYDHFAKLADEHTGIPAYSYGNDRVAGAGRTSSGLSMLMTAAARGIKEVVLGIDEEVIRPLISTIINWNMRNSDDESIKGDLQVISSGAVALMVKEQMASRRLEFLNITNNPTDIELTGIEGRANVLREVASSLEIQQGKVVKTPEEIRDLESERKAMQKQQMEQQSRVEQEVAQLQMANAQMDLKLKQIEGMRNEMGAQLDTAKFKLQAMKDMGKLSQDDKRMMIEARKAALDHTLRDREISVKESTADREDLVTGVEMLQGQTGGAMDEDGEGTDEAVRELEEGEGS